MLKFLLSFVSGPLTSISSDIKEAYESKLKAQNDAERLAADERINLLEARKTIILAAQSDPFERWIRIGIAFGPVVYLNKIFIWDKVLKLGVTDGLSSELSHIMMIVIAGYFLDATVKRFKK